MPTIEQDIIIVLTCAVVMLWRRLNRVELEVWQTLDGLASLMDRQADTAINAAKAIVALYVATGNEHLLVPMPPTE